MEQYSIAKGSVVEEVWKKQTFFQDVNPDLWLS